MTNYYTATNRHTVTVSLDPANKQRDDELLYRREPSYRHGISRSR
ncbi:MULTISPECIES: hypothetical protein [unclassified Wolbachia]|nr:hypothetical protein [Wolbachia endosymbiont (group A) of Apoderus coryli]